LHRRGHRRDVAFGDEDRGLTVHDDLRDPRVARRHDRQTRHLRLGHGARRSFTIAVRRDHRVLDEAAGTAHQDRDLLVGQLPRQLDPSLESEIGGQPLHPAEQRPVANHDEPSVGNGFGDRMERPHGEVGRLLLDEPTYSQEDRPGTRGIGVGEDIGVDPGRNHMDPLGRRSDRRQLTGNRTRHGDHRRGVLEQLPVRVAVLGNCIAAGRVAASEEHDHRSSRDSASIVDARADLAAVCYDEIEILTLKLASEEAR
jgi:hypothetical protein